MADMAVCPECEVMIPVPKPTRLGERLECPECSTQLEVIALRPLELDYAYEDWEEDLEDESDDDLWDDDDDLEDDLDEDDEPDDEEEDLL